MRSATQRGGRRQSDIHLQMNRYFKRNFIFAANRYEEWQGGYCINRGDINCVITAEFSGNLMRVFLSNTADLHILSNFEFEMDGSMILRDRIQYIHSTYDFNPVVPIVCHLFFANGTIDYVRFAMTNPDRIIEFYGQLDKLNQPNIHHDECNKKLDTAQSIMDELNSYGMLSLDPLMERAVKLYNSNSNVQDFDQAKSIVEALKLFVKCNELDLAEHRHHTSPYRPKILAFIALCNYNIGNINRAYQIARKASDAIDDAISSITAFTNISRSLFGEETINNLINAIEREYLDYIDKHVNYHDINENIIDTTCLDKSINLRELIKILIDAISNIQAEFLKIGERHGDPILSFQNNKALEMYKVVLYFAWEKYNFGWHGDFWNEENDSVLEYRMFEIQPTEIINALLKSLRDSSPFRMIDQNDMITHGLITIYEDLIQKMDSKNQTQTHQTLSLSTHRSTT